MSENRKRVKAELRKGVLLYNILNSVDYPAGVREEARKMFKENIQNLRTIEKKEPVHR